MASDEIVRKAANRRYRFGEVELDVRNLRLVAGTQTRPLEPKSFRLLLFLVENQGRTVPKNEIMAAVWSDTFVTDNALTRAIVQVRKALNDDAKEPKYIETVPTVGYRFIAQVITDYPGGLPTDSTAALNPGSPAPEQFFGGAGEIRDESGILTASGNGTLQISSEQVSGRPVDERKSPFPFRAGMFAIAGLLALAGGAALWKAKVATPPLGQIHSIAVLPLENLSRDPDQEFLSEGITEALISNLAQIHSLDVTSRTSAMRYKGFTKPLPEIGRELGVDAIVEGSVQRAGGRVRISVQLIRASTDKHLWANEYERDMVDVLKLESEVARAIAGEIHARIDSQETARLINTHSVVPEAHDEYLLGRYDFLKNTPEDYKQAIAHFNRAIELDPKYAEPYASLAVALDELGGPESEIRAQASVQKALDLDPNSSNARVAFGALKADDWDWTGADQEFRRGLELNPDSIDACGCYGIFLVRLGRVAEALTISEHGVKVDPLSPFAQFAYGGVLYHARRYPEAIDRLKRSIELEPRNPVSYYVLSLIYESNGRAQDAVALLERPEFFGSTSLGLAYAKAGRRNEALTILKNLKSPSDTWRISLIYFALGDNDQGFEWLTKAVVDRHPLVTETKYSPAFDSVRSDPRFQEVVTSFHMPEPR